MKSQVDKEALLKAANEIIRSEGAYALNARALAKKAGCSTQPIYSIFGSMDKLIESLKAWAADEYRKRIDEYMNSGFGSGRYEAYGMGYVKFAREESGLFHLLNRDAPGEPDRIYEPYIEDILSDMMSLYAMDRERALAFHKDMAIYSYGLACRLSDKTENYSDEEISERLCVEFYALYGYYFPEREPLPRK